MNTFRTIIGMVCLAILPFYQVRSQKINLPHPRPRNVYVDKEGVIRWSDDKEEVALFGANYCLPSACDYRAAGYITNDRKKMIDQDMAHFARMGWDGMRICLWGDWENSDTLGNLVVNDHLDLMDYLIYTASERGIYMLFTPIVTYSSKWPDGEDDTTGNGFSSYFKKSELGTSSAAIAAQVNYLKQILNHVNPYTNNAIKDEPFILFIEMINEPHHHPEDLSGSISYINKLVDAVRSTGCRKMLFHNYSQDQRIGDAIKASKVQGVSFAWYPTGLVSGNTLSGNFLRAVDDFPPMHNPVISKLPRIVYEFDVPDTYNSYMYPAMARTYRSVGTQFAAMFSYDMMVTAPYNLGWQTHFLNMVYTPQKAVSAIIAAEAMKVLPRWKDYGAYPDNTSFGPFRVNYEHNLCEMVTARKYMYSNHTSTIPPKPDSLQKIVGWGNSPVVRYEGKGIYFLDKISDGTWRLEVYPDALIVSNPFAPPNPGKVVSRLIHHEWPMAIRLPDMGHQFKVCPLNKGNNYNTMTDNGEFNIYPGVYILYKGEQCYLETLPEYIGYTGMDEFICNEPEKIPLEVVLTYNDEYLTTKPIQIKAEVIGPHLPQEVNLYMKGIGGRWSQFRSFPMKHTGGYSYLSDIAEGALSEGWYEFAIGVVKDGIITTYPAEVNHSPLKWGFPSDQFWKLKIIDPASPLILLDPEKDVKELSFTRIGDNIRWGIFRMIISGESGDAAYRLYFPESIDKYLDDYTVSLNVNQKIDSRGQAIWSAKALKIRARGSYRGQEFYLTLVEEDGTSWTKKVITDTSWTDLSVPVGQFNISRGVKLPQAFPERWSYWVEPAKERGGQGDSIQFDKVELIQISLRPASKNNPDSDSWIETGSIVLLFE